MDQERGWKKTVSDDGDSAATAMRDVGIPSEEADVSATGEGRLCAAAISIGAISPITTDASDGVDISNVAMADNEPADVFNDQQTLNWVRKDTEKQVQIS